ncbi:putative leader peptide [Saccharopolyspora griseoalba]|uniref:Leader peptide n=1 Tax=Saccharopolyspora griseoalba TaxID=1431848 RepID=A0ABW2LSJ2_9PSEU
MTPGDQWRLLSQRLHVDLRRVASARCRRHR